MEIVISIASTIGEYLVAPVGRQFGYLLCYRCNIQDFKDEVHNLEAVQAGVVGRVEAAERNGEVIQPNVKTWLKSVNEITQELYAQEDDKIQVHKRPFNLKLRYKRSRNAKKKTLVVQELKQDGSFATVASPASPLPIGSSSNEDIMVFESRKLTMETIMNALKDDEINMIGIHGISGVGKTSLVKEVGKQAKNKGLYSEVVMAVVSEATDLKPIQDELAEMLGLEFKEKSVSGRARRLFTRLDQKKKKILVILDDIRERVNLEDVGIPFGANHKGCKIVLTSRNEDICNQMGSKKNFSIEVLDEEEAWKLFWMSLGDDSVNSPDIHPVAIEIVKQCGGLPFIILTLARELKNKSLIVWSDTLNKLHKSIKPDPTVTGEVICSRSCV